MGTWVSQNGKLYCRIRTYQTWHIKVAISNDEMRADQKGKLAHKLFKFSLTNKWVLKVIYVSARMDCEIWDRSFSAKRGETFPRIHALCKRLYFTLDRDCTEHSEIHFLARCEVYKQPKRWPTWSCFARANLKMPSISCLSLHVALL